MNQSDQVKVWSLPVRTFHWLLVVSFFISYFTEEDLLTPHVWAGYLVGVLILARIGMGFTGSGHTLFSDFVTPPAEAFLYVKQTLAGTARRYIGHNPAGGLMIVVLIISLIMVVISGLVVYGAGEHAGPLAGLMAGTGKAVTKGYEEIHDLLANFTIMLVIVHVGGVVVESKIHKENLARAMVTGYKRSN